ncbi:hypothetical protein F4778DRAFT_779098 [Xylariomycetidae sp. FL2044]|nr:hypothetical protein F4778DRAFT_779098 [Xylariomycetidae sp. FL2044]
MKSNIKLIVYLTTALLGEALAVMSTFSSGTGSARPRSGLDFGPFSHGYGITGTVGPWDRGAHGGNSSLGLNYCYRDMWGRQVEVPLVCISSEAVGLAGKDWYLAEVRQLMVSQV